jgi:hypothetical protein
MTTSRKFCSLDWSGNWTSVKHCVIANSVLTDPTTHVISHCDSILSTEKKDTSVPRVPIGFRLDGLGCIAHRTDVFYLQLLGHALALSRGERWSSPISRDFGVRNDKVIIIDPIAAFGNDELISLPAVWGKAINWLTDDYCSAFWWSDGFCDTKGRRRMHLGAANGKLHVFAPAVTTDSRWIHRTARTETRKCVDLSRDRVLRASPRACQTAKFNIGTETQITYDVNILQR